MRAATTMARVKGVGVWGKRAGGGWAFGNGGRSEAIESSARSWEAVVWMEKEREQSRAERSGRKGRFEKWSRRSTRRSNAAQSKVRTLFNSDCVACAARSLQSTARAGHKEKKEDERGTSVVSCWSLPINDEPRAARPADPYKESDNKQAIRSIGHRRAGSDGGGLEREVERRVTRTTSLNACVSLFCSFSRFSVVDLYRRCLCARLSL